MPWGAVIGLKLVRLGNVEIWPLPSCSTRPSRPAPQRSPPTQRKRPPKSPILPPFPQLFTTRDVTTSTQHPADTPETSKATSKTVNTPIKRPEQTTHCQFFEIFSAKLFLKIDYRKIRRTQGTRRALDSHRCAHLRALISDITQIELNQRTGATRNLTRKFKQSQLWIS